MKHLYLLGFIIWFILSYFALHFVEGLTNWFSDLNLILKIILAFSTIIIIMFGLHKIILAFVLFNDINNPNFNIISTFYSLIAIAGIGISYFFNNYSFSHFNDAGVNGIITVSFMLSLFWIILSGLIFFPKAIKIK